MGRSFLSIKLAAVFGLMVAAAVTVQQRETAEGSALERDLESGVVVTVESVKAECDEAEHTIVHTARARVRAAAAAAATRS